MGYYEGLPMSRSTLAFLGQFPSDPETLEAASFSFPNEGEGEKFSYEQHPLGG